MEKNLGKKKYGFLFYSQILLLLGYFHMIIFTKGFFGLDILFPLFDLCCNCCDLHKSKCYHLDTWTLLLADLFCSKRQHDFEDFNIIHLSTHLLFSTSTLSFESTFVKLYFEQRTRDYNFILIL